MSLGFLGTQYLSLDTKGRLSLPSRYRDALNGKVVVTIDVGGKCLFFYSLTEWQRVSAAVQALPTMNPKNKKFQRLFFGYASDLDIDSNGRILLPQALRDFAKLDKRVALVGQGHKLELWDEQLWAEESNDTELLDESTSDLDNLIL